MSKRTLLNSLMILILLMSAVSFVLAQGNPPPPPPGGRQGGQGGGRTIDDSVTQVTLDISDVTAYGDALSAQVEAGDGNGIDMYFRNSGVVIDAENGWYYGVNGVHPVNRGDYTSYYPKSIVVASLETDEIVRVYSFSQLNGHEVDMEGLTFAESNDLLYVGDEYNYIYELDVESGDVLREWDLADIGVATSVDKGIEALTYSSETGYFYAGIQETGEILVLNLQLDSDMSEVILVDTFDVGTLPSGLFAHDSGMIYMVSIDGNQEISQYTLDGELTCVITIPTDLNITRPDGVMLDADSEFIYIADSQGPINGGYSMYRIAWTAPCDM